MTHDPTILRPPDPVVERVDTRLTTPDEILRDPPPEIQHAYRQRAMALRPLLLQYQRDWIEDASPAKVCVKSRRIGISWAVAMEAVHCAAKRRSGSDVWYLSQSERDSKQFIRDAARYVRAIDAAARKAGHAPIIANDGCIQVTKIQFLSGHVIQLLPGKNPDSLRGKSGYVIFDESALLDLEACRHAAEAVQNDMKGGRIAFISTQRGEANEFNKLVLAIKGHKLSVAGYSLHEITLEDAIKQGFYNRTCYIRGIPHSRVRERTFYENCMAKPGAQQEFNCVPSREGDQYFARDLVERAMRYTSDPVVWELPDGWDVQGSESDRVRACEGWIRVELMPRLERLSTYDRHSLGWDFGRSARGDLSAAAPCALDNDTARRRVPFLVELTGVPFNQQKQIMHAMIDALPNWDGAIFDAGGNGAWLAEQAQQAYGEGNVERLHLTNRWYEDHVPAYKADLQTSELDLPRYAALITDHEDFVLKDSVPILPKKRRSNKRSGSQGKRHGDAAFACILAHARSVSGSSYVDWGEAESVPTAREISVW